MQSVLEGGGRTPSSIRLHTSVKYAILGLNRKLIARYIVGAGVTVAAERGLPADRQQDIEECIERFKSYYDTNWHQAKPYDGIVPLLEGTG